jgi:hypothetical protein
VRLKNNPTGPGPDIYICIFLELTSGNMFEKLGAWMLNRVWTQEWRGLQVLSTGPQDMAKAIIANLGVEVSYPGIPFDGARLAAKCILERAGIHVVG